MIEKNVKIFLQQVYLVIHNQELRRMFYIRSRRLFRVILFLICVTLILTILHIRTIIIKYDAYQKFLQVHPFSTVPFWKDNRTINQKPLLPVLKIEDVNLSNASIAVVACCRNVRRHLKGFQRNVAAITSLFGHYRIYLCESDSFDYTLKFLEEWQKNDSKHVRVHSDGPQSRLIPSRTTRLAVCRNHLLREAFTELPSLDYYLVMDVDVGSSPSFEVKDFLTNFIYPSSSWFAMTATQRAEYYDIWALRLESILSYDCWAVICELSSLIVTQSFLSKRIVEIHQLSVPRNRSLIEAQSAFGGAALYNAKYLDRRCSYNGTIGIRYGDTAETCEHVSFHRCLGNKAKEQKLYINPQFQIC